MTRRGGGALDGDGDGDHAAAGVGSLIRFAREIFLFLLNKLETN